MPRIRLRTIFLLFVCAAVGLSIDPDPFGSLQPAIATAMVIGLLQQCRQLLGWWPAGSEAEPDLTFAWRFAVAWRLGLVGVMSAYLLVDMLLARSIFVHPERDDILIIQPLAYVLPLCMIIVVCNSLIRWGPIKPPASPRVFKTGVLWALGITIGLIMIVEGTTVEFLVHRAVANIEAAFPKHLQRDGVYVQFSDEGYLSLWLALGAVVSIIAAAVTVVRWRHVPKSESKAALSSLLTVFLLVILPAAFCYWYYASALYRLSPEIAVVGLAPIWIDWIAAVAIAVMLVTAGAYRIARRTGGQATIIEGSIDDVEQDAFHESFPCLLLLATNAVYAFVVLATEILQYHPFLGTPSLGRYISMFCYPTTLVVLAFWTASLQLCWRRWKYRLQPRSWKIHNVLAQRFLKAWVALALILIVGIPTVRAFAFILWLGPFNLLPLFGL